MSEVRVRFAPSPTGALHIGGVRTALYNYLFAKKNGGKFILRIEDTDQTRFVPGAEEYITESLTWLGLTPDESPSSPGEFGPYRQSERKNIYQEYAQKLLDEGNAYYAFDSPEELDEMRARLQEAGATATTYNTISRKSMKNSLTLSAEEVKEKIDAGEPYVIRLKVPHKEDIRINDMVRSWVVVHSSAVDDKVIMKSDGMPTYHLANVVDDHLMKITHVIRGEEWLPSAPSHVLLYRFLGWEDTMPQFSHLPLLLKPDGNGKLSKRAADKLGFPVFPINWNDPVNNELSIGFREQGYLKEALINFLVLLGWNPGTEREIFSLEELSTAFTPERIGKSGAKFDIEKAKWFNQQYIKHVDTKTLSKELLKDLNNKGITCDPLRANEYVELMRDRITFITDIFEGAHYLFNRPTSFDEKVARKRWTEEAAMITTALIGRLKTVSPFESEQIHDALVTLLEEKEVKMGKVMQAIRLSITGVGGGPDLMKIIELLGAEETCSRMQEALNQLEVKIENQ